MENLHQQPTNFALILFVWPILLSTSSSFRISSNWGDKHGTSFIKSSVPLVTDIRTYRYLPWIFESQTFKQISNSYKRQKWKSWEDHSVSAQTSHEFKISGFPENIWEKFSELNHHDICSQRWQYRHTIITKKKCTELTRSNI